MKKILIAAFVLLNIALLASSCERDRCPAHGGDISEKNKNV